MPKTVMNCTQKIMAWINFVSGWRLLDNDDLSITRRIFGSPESNRKSQEEGLDSCVVVLTCGLEMMLLTIKSTNQLLAAKENPFGSD